MMITSTITTTRTLQLKSTMLVVRLYCHFLRRINILRYCNVCKGGSVPPLLKSTFVLAQRMPIRSIQGRVKYRDVHIVLVVCVVFKLSFL